MRARFIPAILTIFYFSTVKAQFVDPEMVRFAEKFKKALMAQQVDSLIALKPTPEIWRKLYPAETRKLKDEDIIRNINKNEKTIEDYNNIIESAKQEKVNLAGLQYVSYKLNDSPDGKMFSAEIKYKYGGRDEVVFSFSLVRYETTFYLNEILLSYEIFKRYYFNR